MFNFKKLIAVVFAVVILTVPFAVNAEQENINVNKNTINIVVEAERVVADNFLYNDTTYVQLRKITEMLGKKVEWVESEKAAYISDTDTPEITDTTVVTLTEEKGVTLPVDRNTITIYVNGVKVEGDNFLFEGRTYVPLRKIAEMFENTVSWDQLTNTATIGAKTPSVFDGEVLGTINGMPYTQKLFDDYVYMFKVNNPTIDPSTIDLESVIIEQIKQDYIVIEMATQFGISAGVTFENGYQDAITYFIQQYGSEEILDQTLAQSGYTHELYHFRQLLAYLSEKIMATELFAVTPEEAKAYYDANLDVSFKYDGLRAKHVLVRPVTDESGAIGDAQWEDAKKRIDEVYALATSGTSFDELIAKYNEDPGMQANPDGYIFTRGEMVEEFETMAYSLEVGQISVPVKTSYGYHVIKLEEKIPYYEYGADVEEFIILNLPAERFYTYIEKLALEAVVEKAN